MRIEDITIGADPELFIINTKTKKVVSSVGKIPGTKAHPYHAKDMPEGFALQTDNILVEFNIPPCKCREEFVHNIEYMKEYIQNYVKNINSNYDILCASSQNVSKSELRSKQAREYGCDADYNAYTERMNVKPEALSTTTRAAGFHLHVGYKNNNIDSSVKLIKYLDAFIGVPSILRDTDTERRKLYGNAGCFRLASYGFEYRSLGSALMKDTESLEFIYNQLMRAILAYNLDLAMPFSSDIREAIDTSNVELANTLISTYNLIA